MVDICGRQHKLKINFASQALIESDTAIDYLDLQGLLRKEIIPVRIVRSILTRGLEGAGMDFNVACEVVDQWYDEVDDILELYQAALLAYAQGFETLGQLMGNDEAATATAAM